MRGAAAGSSLLLAGAVLGGCYPAHVRGEIQDLAIHPKDAFFFAQPEAFGDDSLVGIIVTELPRGCEDYGYYLNGAPGFNSPETRAQAWATVFPPEFWDIAILLRSANPAASLTGQQFVGVPYGEGVDELNEAQTSFIHNKLWRDVAFYDGTGDPLQYVDTYLSDGGTVAVKDHTPGQRIRGTLTANTRNAATGASTGLLQVTFNAVFCPEADFLDSAFAD